MAYVVQPNAVLEVTFEATQDSQLIMTVFHYRLEAGGPIADGAAAAQQAISAIQSAGALRDKYADCVPDVITNFHTYAQWITPGRFRYERSPGPDWAGTVANNPLAVNQAVALTKFGEQANRSNIGTVHMPAVPISFVANSVLTVQALIDYDNLCGAIPTPLALGGGNTLRPCLFSKSNPSASAIVVGAFPQPQARVMRRRTVGVGA